MSGFRLPSLTGSAARECEFDAADAPVTQPAISPERAVPFVPAPQRPRTTPVSAASPPDPAATWSGAVCSLPGDKALLVADWLVVASSLRGTLVEATTLGSGVTSPHGMFLDAAEPERADAQLADVPRRVLDFVVCGDLTELARLTAAGYLDPEHSVVVAAARRALSAAELAAPPEHVLSDVEIETLAAARAAKFVSCDVDRICEWHDLPRSAAPGMLFGALCATGVAGLDEALCHAAIVSLGIDVQESLEGFSLGLIAGQRSGGRRVRRSSAVQFVRRTRMEIARDERIAYRDAIERIDEVFPEAHREQVRELVHTLSAYESVEYARRAVERCEALLADERRAEVAETSSAVPIVARHLQQILLHPDLPWAAQVASRQQRLPQLRARHGLPRNTPYQVLDHLQIDAAELAQLRAGVARRGAKQDGNAALASGLSPVDTATVNTVSAAGQAQLRAWMRLRRGRRYTHYYARAIELAGLYVSAVRDATTVDPELAQLVARTGGMVYGAGAIRSATAASAEALWGRVIRPAIAVDRIAGTPDRAATTDGVVIPDRAIHADRAVFSNLTIRWACTELIRRGPRAIWDVHGQILAISLAATRGGSYADALAFARALSAE